MPGERVGDLVIGESSAVEILGSVPGAGWEELRSGGLWTWFSADGKLAGVMVDSPNYATAEGVSVGTSPSTLLGAYGNPTKQSGDTQEAAIVAAYDGIAFGYGAQGVGFVWVEPCLPAFDSQRLPWVEAREWWWKIAQEQMGRVAIAVSLHQIKHGVLPAELPELEFAGGSSDSAVAAGRGIVDPWGNLLVYGRTAMGGFRLQSRGPDGLLGTPDDQEWRE